MSMPTAREVFCHGPRLTEEQRNLEERFFRDLRMPNGTYKTTAAGRLATFDELILRHLRGRSQLTILDVGIASGITTLDLATRLQEIGCRYRIVATDRYLHAKLLRLAPGVDALLAADGDILQLSLGSWTRPLPQGTSRGKGAFLQVGLGVIAALVHRWNLASDDIVLVTAGIRNSDMIDLVEQDIEQFRSDWENEFDLIRAANVLNRSYFGLERLAAIVGHLARYLKDGGLLAVCRSDDIGDRHHGNVFVKDTHCGRMKRIDQMGAGSEVGEIVLGTSQFDEPR